MFGGFKELADKVAPKKKRKSPKEKTGRLISRTPLASKTRWRRW